MGDGERTANRSASALTFYERALTGAPGQTDELIARGLIAWIRGDLVYARYYLKAASLSDGENVALAWLYRGDLALSEGDIRTMQSDYQTAFSRLDSYSTFGPGTLGEITYAVNVFGRYGYVTDYLPDVVLLDIGRFEAARFVNLAHIRAETGDVAEAIHILRRILLSNPDYTPAQAALQSLTNRK